MTYHNYEWTAFTEADFLDQGGNGSSIGCGDTFTMPGTASVTMSTWDNDSKLSGDNWSNDVSNDQSGQNAYIDGHKVGGKVYAESYHVLHGSDGKTYYMIEIEIEGHNAPGAGDDYFTFYGAVPPAGVTLNVTQTCNVKGEWVDFSCLGAGDTVPANTAPTFTNVPDNGVLMIDENTTFVIDLSASDADGDALTYEITGGRDAAFFEIDAHTGELSFVGAPDFENPQSGGNNNTYDVTVTVSDGNGGTETKPMWVKVQDVDENTGGGECIVIEAEDMNLYHMNTFHSSSASGGAGARIDCLGGSGDLSTTFNGSTGNYDLTIYAQDESDGQSTIMVKVNGVVVGTVALNNDNDGYGSNNGNFSAFTIEDIALNAGDEVMLWVQSDHGEYVRLDKIELCKDGEICDNVLDFEGFASGTVIDNQFDGVTITAQRATHNTAANDAMIFDSNNPTGGDHDLEYQGRGNILIISEDNDSNDADDAIGGKMTFDFDNPSDLHDIVLLDIEEAGGTIMLTFEDGSTQTIAIPAAGNNSAQTVNLDATGVTQMMITLTGSGAVDDLCWSPGEAPALGSIAGTYFMDNNDNSVQDGADMGLEGQTVWLLENGVGIVGQTTTDANGDYIFEGLEAGDYTVRFDGNNVDGKTLVESNVGNDDTIDSDIDFTGSAGNHNTGTITLGAGDNITDVDAGVEDPAGSALEGRVFMDSDDDNQDNGEMGVEGVTVTLLNADGSATGRTTTTAADGSYAFAGLVAGGYIVSFPTNVDGKTLVDSNVGNDATDSDALANGQTGVINLGINETSSNNDAGVEDPGTASIGDKLFLDTNGNGQQDDGEAGVDGVEVTLTDADGNTQTTTTANGGMYLFDGLDAGDYVVDFADVDGFDFTTQNNGNDATDSDVDANGSTDPVSLAIGEANMTVDAGIVSEGPDAADDAAMTCANEEVTVDVLANDGATAATITQVGGQDIAEGETVTVGGVEVTLSGGQLVFDGEVAYESLDIGESAVATISYTVADIFGGTSMADVDVTFCGTAETLQEICDSLPATASIQVINENNPIFTSNEAYTVQITSGDARLDGVYAEAYCVANFDSLLASGNGSDIDLAPIFEGALFCAVESEVPAGSLTTMGINGMTAAQNLDMITYILNQDFGSQGYTDAEVQGAIWALTDGEELNEINGLGGVSVIPGAGTPENALEILNDALANGEGYEAGSGDIVGLIVDPADDAFDQPFVFGVAFDDLDCLC